MVPLAQLSQLLLLDLHRRLLVLGPSGQIELNVLAVAASLLQLVVLLLEHFKCISLGQQLLLHLAKALLEAIDGHQMLALRLLKLSNHLVGVVKLGLLQGEVSLPLQRQLLVVLFERLQFLMDTSLLLAFDQAAVLVFRSGTTHQVVELLLFQLQVLLQLRQLPPGRVNHDFLLLQNREQ